MRHLASNFMNRLKDKTLKNLVCKATLATKVRKFNKHMDTIERINLEAQQWLEAIPFEKWALSHDGGQRYRIMTPNMSEVFNSVLKGTRSLSVTALVKFTFFRLKMYFVAKREQGYNRLASNEQLLHMLMLRLRHTWLKLGHLRLFFTITTRDDFMSSQREVEHIASTYMTINALMIRHLYVDFPLVIL